MTRRRPRSLATVAMLATAAALVALQLAAAGSGCAPSSRPGPTRRVAAVAPATYENYLRGRLAHFRGDYDEAVERLEAVARADPEQPDVAVALIEALLAAERVERALATASWARRRFPFNARIALADARAALARGDLERARRAAYRAISIERRLRAAHLLLADIHAERRDRDRELGARRAVVELWPDWWRGRHLYGTALLAAGRLDQAEAQLRVAVDQRPGYLPSRLALAGVLARRGRADEADDLLRETFDRRRGTAAAARRIARDTLRDLGAERATEVLRAIDRDDLSLGTRYAIAELLLDMAAPAHALRVARALGARAPNSPAVSWLEGRCHEHAGRPDRAIQAWLRVPPDAGVAARARGRAAVVLAATGQTERGLALARDVAALAPDDVDAIASIAHATAYASGPEAGRAWFDGALTSNPDDRALGLAAARFELVWGEPQLAYQRAAPLLADADDADAANVAGYSLVLAGEELERAEELLRRASELAPDDPAILDSRGLLLLRRGDVDGALELLARAGALLPAAPDVALHLGEALLAGGSKELARAAFARANRLSRVGDEATRARARAFLRAAEP